MVISPLQSRDWDGKSCPFFQASCVFHPVFAVATQNLAATKSRLRFVEQLHKNMLYYRGRLFIKHHYCNVF